MATPIVLHLDVDAFFCQVEALRSPDTSIMSRPLAVQQHQDIISVNYAARAAGVKKHMPPAEARRLLVPHGGQVVHVYCEGGTRVSYRPYRETSAALLRLVQRLLPPGAVCEKASIDEAFILLPCGDAHAEAPGGMGHSGVAPHAAAGPFEYGERVGQELRRACRAELRLSVSVGVACNKLLAKLASWQAKPDGLRVVRGGADTEALLQATPITKLPGMGGAVAQALAQVGVSTAAALRQLSADQLVQQLGLRPADAALLAAWAQGQDPREVVDRGPPKSIQVQMTLTPVPLAVPQPLRSVELSHAECGQRPGWLMPLVASEPEGWQRLQQLLRAMAADLLSRVLLDRHQEGRWPSRLALQMVTHGPSGRSASKSCAFPSPALIRAQTAPADAAPANPGAATACPGAATAAAGPETLVGSPKSMLPLQAAGGAGRSPSAAARPADPTLMVGEKTYGIDDSSQLLAATAGNAEQLAKALLALGPAGLPVTQVHLAARQFGPFEAAASRDIRQMLCATVAAKLVRATAPAVADAPAGTVEAAASDAQHAAGARVPACGAVQLPVAPSAACSGRVGGPGPAVIPALCAQQPRAVVALSGHQAVAQVEEEPRHATAAAISVHPPQQNEQSNTDMPMQKAPTSTAAAAAAGARLPPLRPRAVALPPAVSVSAIALTGAVQHGSDAQCAALRRQLDTWLQFAVEQDLQGWWNSMNS